MRLPFPTHIPLFWAAVFAVGMVVVQQFQHTNLAFSLLFLGFVMLSTAAFNVAGGLSRPSGGFILFFALLSCIVGVIWKAYLGEPADTNLYAPLTTMTVYCLSMVGMLAGVYAVRKWLKGKPPFIARIGGEGLRMHEAAVGCLLVALALNVVNFSGLLAGGQGSAITAINQINLLYPLAIILGTLDTIRATDGRRSIGFTNGLAMACQFVIGVQGFSKQAMFIPVVAWLVAAASLRFRLRAFQMIGVGVSLFLLLWLFVPVSQLGRDLVFPGETFAQRVELAVGMIDHPLDLRKQYKQNLEYDTVNIAEGLKVGYYNTDQGFASRLSMISIDDELISFTDRGHIEGLRPLRFDFINLIPHVILPHKEKYDVAGGEYSNHGNYYAHEMEIISNDDTTTGISISSAAEVFHLESWLGTLLIGPLVWALLFFVSDGLWGDPRRSPWALFLVIYFAHVAPEGNLGALVGGIEMTTIGLVATMYFCIQFAPILGALFSGSLHRSVGTAPSIRAPQPATAA